MSAEGLSRRRGAPIPSSSNLNSPNTNNNSSSSQLSPNSTRPTTPLASPKISTTNLSNNSNNPSNNSAGSSAGGGGGHKIAFDQRDMESGEESIMPKLTIMEEVLLLGLKDKQGYLSFWNDNISYTLRGCIILELALRHRIAMVKDPNRRRFPLADRFIEVVDERMTGEVLLDEALKMMKTSEKMSVGTWIDLMSGETWNVMKIGYQLKQVRERLAKGLVDKGVLRTEKRNFLLFDMATHPVSDPTFKEDVLKRTLSLLTARTAAVPMSELYDEKVRYRTIRAVSMVCAAFAANVLENAFIHLSYEARESAFAKCDELMSEFSQWPFGTVRAAPTVSLGSGSGSGQAAESANLAEINRLARGEIVGVGDGTGEGRTGSQGTRELHLEVVAAVIEIMKRMDSLL